jgi:hypothetical protein
MIKLVIPFSLDDIKQIPSDLIIKKNIGLEGSLFDINKLNNNCGIQKLCDQLTILNKKFPKALKSLHFPTEDANYISDTEIKNKLYGFIDLAARSNVPFVVLHSNYIQSLVEFDVLALKSTRSNFIKFFQKLNIYAREKNVIICIENMPIIGSLGMDYDSIFVFPEDFKDLIFSNIKINRDLCHWAYTYYTILQLSNFSPQIKTKSYTFDDFIRLMDLIEHFHFGSFSGMTYPYSQSKRNEGINPSKGFVDEKLFIKTLRKIHTLKRGFGLVLEIREKDYRNRVELRETIDWFEKNIFN